MKKLVVNTLTCITLCFIGVPVFAAPIDVVSYDITNTRLSGDGSWQHTYSGTISSNNNGTYNYTGGSGTLNDGVIGTGLQNTHLLRVGDQSVITLYLGGSSTVSALELYSYETSSNHIPGNILGLYVTINGVTEYIQTNGFGPANTASQNDHVHESLSFVGTALDGLVTDTIMLSGFVADGSWSTHYGISEVMVYGSPVSGVPEPAAILLLSTGLFGLVVMRRRRK